MPLSPTPVRPGERLLNGAPYVFNADLLGLHEAHDRVVAAPALLDGLTYDQLGVLKTSALTVLSAERSLAPCLPYALDLRTAELLHKRASAEQAQRAEHRRAFGSAARPQRRAA